MNSLMMILFYVTVVLVGLLRYTIEIDKRNLICLLYYLLACVYLCLLVYLYTQTVENFDL